MRDEEELEYLDNPQLANWDSLKRNRDIFDGEVEREVQYKPVHLGKTGYTGGPYLRISGDFHYSTSGGKRRPFRNTTLFTWTSKMSCPSFSLPAGPMESGGTCPAAKASSIQREGSYLKHSPSIDRIPEGQLFICDTCYAGKGRYLMYKSMSLGQAARLRWTQDAVRSGTFSRKISEAIASLDDPDVEKVLAQRLVSNKYFRIHDSGDFYNPEYYKAWLEVCYNLPQIHFWAPTRMWVYEKWREVFSNYPPPGNLSLRPSALFTSSPPPSIAGMAGGSTSIDGRMPAPVWNCPAYESEEGSCAGAKCRVCWDAQRKPVNYLTH